MLAALLQQGLLATPTLFAAPLKAFYPLRERIALNLPFLTKM
jgi:hypothetical protein